MSPLDPYGRPQGPAVGAGNAPPAAPEQLQVRGCGIPTTRLGRGLIRLIEPEPAPGVTAGGLTVAEELERADKFACL